MAAREIPDPDIATSVHRLQVRFGETDLMGVVHHASYLLYCEAARVSYESWVRHGVHLPVVDASLRYKQPARFDEIVEVETTVVEITRVTVRYRYRMRRGDTLLCEAHTLLACVGDDMSLRRLPDDVRKVFTSSELPADQWAPRV
jgi:acyl-CoA thioester hydrolase